MKDSQTIQKSPGTSSMKMLRAMVGIGIGCALMIVLTFEGTLPRIEKNKAEALQQAIFKVIPGISQTQGYRYDSEQGFVALAGEEKAEQVVYAGFDSTGVLKGIAIEARGQGYADILTILYGYDPEQEAVVGFYVLASKETPGLGDKIEKDPIFLANFEALDVSLDAVKQGIANPVTTVKRGAKTQPWEIDGITGATISSRAIGDIIRKSSAQWMPLLYQHKASFELKKTE